MRFVVLALSVLVSFTCVCGAVASLLVNVVTYVRPAGLDADIEKFRQIGFAVVYPGSFVAVAGIVLIYIIRPTDAEHAKGKR